ncbi:chromo domain-containing protein [Trichonephila clavipes]|nr:chromo domain-containing protein [Trichonephila clavipes]
MTPASVTETNQSQVWENLYDKQNNKKVNKPNYRLNDTVRISKEKLLFEKGYEQNWTREIFTIHDIIRRNPIVYKLKDLAGEVIRGTFYEQELQKVTHSGYYPIEKILKTREKNGKKEYFVKFLGYPEKFNTWSDLVEPQIVGDVQAPLLKIVKVEGKDGEVVNAHYTRPHYVPVIRRHFQTVEMVLRLHSGELVPFERGRVIAVLHFRMRQIV